MGLRSALRKYAAKHLILEQSKPVLLKDLVYVGVDSDGKKYFSWEKMEDLPRNRFVEIEKTNMYIDNKISPQNLITLSSAIIDCNNALVHEKDDKKRGVLHAQIGALSLEISFREKYAIPSQVLVALASIVTIREDEDPSVYSQRIQTEKSETFSRELEKGNYFFLNTPIFKALIPSLIMSNDQWMIHLGKLVSQNKHELERLQTILSKRGSASTDNKRTV